MTKIPFIPGFNAYLRTRRISKRAHDEYLNSLHDFFDYLIEHNNQFKASLNVTDIHDGDIVSYKQYLEHELSYSPSTINKILSNLNVYFAYLFSNKITKEFPTLNIKSLTVEKQSDFPTRVFTDLPKYLNDVHLHIYTRLLILIISKGFNYQEALSSGFYQTFDQLAFNSDEKAFLSEYREFIEPWQSFWGTKNLFLSRNKGAQSPLLSVSALYRSLKADSEQLNLDLSAKKLSTTIVLIALSQKRPNQEQLQLIDKLDANSLLYYRRLLRETDFKI